MDISATTAALIGGVMGATISGLISAYTSHKSLKQAARDKLISSAYDAAIAEFSVAAEIYKAYPQHNITAFAHYLVYHIAFIQGIGGSSNAAQLEDRAVLAALDRAKNLSLLRSVTNTNTRAKS